jgi:hypothetical protein
MDTTLTPTDLFSPSKARQQRAQAQDWASVDSWLSTKYPGRSLPTFERNEDTLRALLALAAANERADEERELVESVEREALNELSKQEVRMCQCSQSLLVAKKMMVVQTANDTSSQVFTKKTQISLMPC